MTVNERLCIAGLLDDFYYAVREKDVIKVISVLKEVELDTENINGILAFENLSMPDFSS